ncbi:MAG: MFS transporter [Tepidamorphaceae bacterium]|nr:MFS transporter [Rhodobiaceae bacterium]MCC0048238.1 MFS transporter [Rhodobiaceae bacterium]
MTVERDSSVRAGAAAGASMTTAVLLVGALAAVYFISQFLRNSIGVIAPNLEAELGLGSESLGLLSSVFFFSFALAQIPIGILIDRFGPRAVMLGSLTLAALGSVVFSYAGGMGGLILARVLMGLGCSSFFMCPLTIFTRWFARDRFSTLVGIQLGLGSLGTLFATAPMAFSVGLVGWRDTFVIFAAIIVAIGFVAAAIIRDDPPGTPTPVVAPATLGSAIAGLRDVWVTPGVFRLLGMHFFSYSAFATIAGLWGGPYLTDVYGHDLQERGFYLLLMAAGQVIGVLFWGPMDRWFGGPKKPAIVAALLTVATLVGFAIAGRMPEWILGPAFAWFGFICAFTPLVTGHGRHLFPPELIGRGITFLNIGTMGGVFLLQLFTGLVVAWITGEAGVRPLAAYSGVFLCVAGALFVAVVFYLRAPDARMDSA